MLGLFTKCEPGKGYGSLTLDEVFDDCLLPLNVPVFRGAAIGHIKRKLAVPVGAVAEMDAEGGRSGCWGQPSPSGKPAGTVQFLTRRS